jgi:hypothetical protein
VLSVEKFEKHGNYKIRAPVMNTAPKLATCNLSLATCYWRIQILIVLDINKTTETKADRTVRANLKLS